MTPRPMSAAPSSTWLPRSESVSELICLFISEMPETELNCASWPTCWAGSMGLNGSWCLSCVSIRVRKSSWLSSVRLALASLAARRCAATSELWFWLRIAALMMSMSSMFETPYGTGLSALAQPQRRQQQVLGCVHDFDVVLVRARGGDHVDHLLHGVDRGRVHVAIGVGQRVAGLVARQRRGRRLVDAAHPDRGVRVVVLGVGAQRSAHRLEDGMPRLVDLGGVAADALGVGEIAGRGVQAH